MNLRKFADIFGGIPFFVILIIYFYCNNRTNIETILLICCIFALIIDIYLSFIYKINNVSK